MSVPARGKTVRFERPHAAAVGGVQWAFVISGIAALLAGVAVLVLMRPPKTAPAPADSQPAAAELATT